MEPENQEMTQEEINSLQRLQAIDDFRNLTPIQKKILFKHVSDPTLSKDELAKTLKVKKDIVYGLFYNPKFERINEEIALQEKRELVQLAITTLRDCLNSPNPSVRYAAASRILNDCGVLKTEPKTVKQDNKITVVWGNNQSLGEIKNAEPINTLLPPPEAA